MTVLAPASDVSAHASYTEFTRLMSALDGVRTYGTANVEGLIAPVDAVTVRDRIDEVMVCLSDILGLLRAEEGDALLEECARWTAENVGVRSPKANSENIPLVRTIRNLINSGTSAGRVAELLGLGSRQTVYYIMGHYHRAVTQIVEV